MVKKTLNKAKTKVRKDIISTDDKEEGAAVGLSEKEIKRELDMIEAENGVAEEVSRVPFSITASKPIGQIVKGDSLAIDGKMYKVDAHYVLIDHGNTKEMVIEVFDSADSDYQLRYFDDQMETTLEFYRLDEIIYSKLPFKAISW